ncbi:hypothetical protein PILCRDRAFT_12984 [Piloderma croceum F 1598]|uniref:Uncharacterized protein n=1 Tax=Piloderma croceum (strain F 1598) TaxID=765440 RepID=A0A0C3EUP6_PILCF|nr:hypothetical protein PILCRDRAFT_12984 [Piloderma croceum F 1598]
MRVSGLYRTLAYPYGALVPGPPNLGGLRPKGPIPFTEFRASGADMYGYAFPLSSPYTLVKLAASRNKRTLEEADEGEEDDREDNRPKKKARAT